MSEKILIKGNEAIAEAAIAAGCRHFFGYPITPQSELAAYLARRMPKVGGVYLQAESEVAAINMVYGAAAAGVRCMTSSSSPGISLKSEGLSYLAGCDLPAVLINVQRGGPGLGGIQPSQADYFQATRGGGHGDYHIIVLAPGGVQEMYSYTRDAFDLADKHRMTVMVLTDGILGQMMEATATENGEQTADNRQEKPWAVGGVRGERARNIVNSLYLKPSELEATNLSRYEKYKQVEETEQKYDSYLLDDAEIVVAAYGASSRIAKNAIDEARSKGVKAGLLRPITLWPFPKKAFAAAAKKARAFVSVEMSMGQMIEDIELSIRCSRPVTLCNRVGGMVPDPAMICEAILNANKEATA
ncbi:MAG: 3-methyl-2-oxobutanoate dehydrogenase subunit VorB [Oscillospiraceae bacterium]|jgi:2-oxoglutarate ferredoxin oxidoreductase subunit alpha|nr:3-methyl-2-oxobutanoate dehydrogenase subunit VorB [Oscillospiraceae bacterium]